MTREDEDRDVALFQKLERAIAQAIVDLKLPREEDLRVDILLHVLAKMAEDYAIEDGISIDDFLAGMRCYVASKLGDNVEIPEELMEQA